MTDLGLIWQEALLCQYSGGLLQYSNRITPVLLIGLLQYLHWITPVLLLDYSSTSIGLLQYFYPNL